MKKNNIVICQFCGYSDSLESDFFQVDECNKGFWCENCDGYTYIDKECTKHRFTLILEDKAGQELRPDKKRKFDKRLSPYRYPGGKSKIVDYLYNHLQGTKSIKLISPFTGGGSFELAMLDAGVVDKLILNDIDIGVYSLWWVIKHMPYALIERIISTSPTRRDYYKAQAIIKNGYYGVDVVDAAWYSLLVNRLAYSGVYKANPLGGRNGTLNDLLSRWNPDSLIKRIDKINSLGDRIEVTQVNAVDLIEEAYWQEDATIFIDPPYVNKGKELYPCFYSEEDHLELSCLLDSLYHGCPGADILVTYDYNQWLVDSYEFPKTEIIGRRYSA